MSAKRGSSSPVEIPAFSSPQWRRLCKARVRHLDALAKIEAEMKDVVRKVRVGGYSLRAMSEAADHYLSDVTMYNWTKDLPVNPDPALTLRRLRRDSSG